jgi:hypothetical protein
MVIGAFKAHRPKQKAAAIYRLAKIGPSGVVLF